MTKGGIARHIARGLDPVVLAGEIGMTPDEWQQDVLRSRADRILLNCCRQSGKSTVGALLAVWTALYEAGSLSLVVSPTDRQARELFRIASVTYRSIGRPVAAESENRSSLELENGSRIIVVSSGAAMRGYAGVRLIILDEAAQIEDEAYHGEIRPMLAVSSGRLVAMSTPFGRRGWFFRAWDSEPEWLKIKITASECPRITPAFLEQERRTIGSYFFRQEYEGEFVDTVDQMFGSEYVHAALSSEVVPLFGGAR